MKKRIACLIAVGLLAAMLIGCAAWQSKSDDAWQFTADSASAMEAAALYAAPEESAVPIPDPDAKIIYTADMDLETTGFDDAAAALSALTADCGGYYESSSLSNSGDRVARYTIRVPADRYREFISRAGEVCHLLEKHEHAEDVSEVYYDTAGRLETQQAKLARLRELLDQAENMEDIIALESAVSETEEQIDWLSGQLGRYDSLADYSTVTVTLREVRRLSSVPDPAQSLGGRMGDAFRRGLDGFADGMETLLLALAYGWEWLALGAAALTAAILLIRRAKRKRSAK